MPKRLWPKELISDRVTKLAVSLVEASRPRTMPVSTCCRPRFLQESEAHELASTFELTVIRSLIDGLEKLVDPTISSCRKALAGTRAKTPYRAGGPEGLQVEIDLTS